MYREREKDTEQEYQVHKTISLIRSSEVVQTQWVKNKSKNKGKGPHLWFKYTGNKTRMEPNHHGGEKTQEAELTSTGAQHKFRNKIGSKRRCLPE